MLLTMALFHDKNNYRVIEKSCPIGNLLEPAKYIIKKPTECKRIIQINFIVYSENMKYCLFEI